jgi:PAS domain S-box-containing protein
MIKNVIKKPNALSAIYIASLPVDLLGNNMLYELAFTNSLQPTMITFPATAKIISVNKAACKLLGYSAKELTQKHREDIFAINDKNYKKMLRQRKTRGHSTVFLTGITKKGTSFPCLVTSAVFMDTDGAEKAILSLSDLSQSILKQKHIDAGKEKIVAGNIELANSRQKTIDLANGKIVNGNIKLARSRQRRIDTAKGKIIAANIILAQSKSDKARQRYQKLADKKTVRAFKLKEKQIADAMEDAKDTARSDMGKELHDNINQLLGASRMYIEMAKRGCGNSKMYLNRSSEYTLTAIEEIRNLTRGITTETIVQLGLVESIENMAADIMQVNHVKIECALQGFRETDVDRKFKLNIYRIVQEHLNNILKHANAMKITIGLVQKNKEVILNITDDGVGFDVHKKQKGIGVENIKSRAASYKGTASIISQPGEGCILHVTFPIEKAAAGTP